MTQSEHPEVSAARISGRAAIIVAIITGISGWVVAGISLFQSQSDSTPSSREAGLETEVLSMKARISSTMHENEVLRDQTNQLQKRLDEMSRQLEKSELTIESLSSEAARLAETEKRLRQKNSTNLETTDARQCLAPSTSDDYILSKNISYEVCGTGIYLTFEEHFYQPNQVLFLVNGARSSINYMQNAASMSMAFYLRPHRPQEGKEDKIKVSVLPRN